MVDRSATQTQTETQTQTQTPNTNTRISLPPLLSSPLRLIFKKNPGGEDLLVDVAVLTFSVCPSSVPTHRRSPLHNTTHHIQHVDIGQVILRSWSAARTNTVRAHGCLVVRARRAQRTLLSRHSSMQVEWSGSAVSSLPPI